MSLKGKTLNYILLLLIGVIWGSQFVFNELALKDLPPSALSALRIIVGAIALTVLIWVLPKSFSEETVHEEMPQVSRKKLWWRLFIIGIFEAILPFFLVAWGQQHVDSSIAAILMGTIPIFTVILARFLVKGDKLTWGNIIAIVLGFVGVVVLVAPGIHGDILKNLAGEVAILLGAASFALSLILIKRLPVTSPIGTARNILAVAIIPMVIISLLFGDASSIHHVGWQAWVSVLILGVFCAGIVYVLYVLLIHLAGPTFASFNSYLVPLVGAIIGVVFLHDAIHWYTIIALVIILLAMGANELKFGAAK